MIKRTFEQWLFEDVEIEFGLTPIDTMPELEAWLDTTDKPALSPDIEKLRISLLKNVKILNEDELKMLFIAPFLLNFDFHNPPLYRVFTQRLMSLKTKTVESSGKVEWMVATGKQRPRKPFFFLQVEPQSEIPIHFGKYKPERHSSNDPLGQLLIPKFRDG